MAGLRAFCADLGFEDARTGTRGIGRNWNTVIKLAALANA
jgi:uncharacterized protein (DUF1697 family)